VGSRIRNTRPPEQRVSLDTWSKLIRARLQVIGKHLEAIIQGNVLRETAPMLHDALLF
jgi:hypothetical protein